MSKILPITSSQFDNLIQCIDSYVCNGYSCNVNSTEKEWQILHFGYDGSVELGLNFTLAHPYSSLSERIDYNVIEIRFDAMYPFPQEWGFRITNEEQVNRLTDIITPLYNKCRNSGNVSQLVN